MDGKDIQKLIEAYGEVPQIDEQQASPWNPLTWKWQDFLDPSRSNEPTVRSGERTEKNTGVTAPWIRRRGADGKLAIPDPKDTSVAPPKTDTVDTRKPSEKSTPADKYRREVERAREQNKKVTTSTADTSRVDKAVSKDQGPTPGSQPTKTDQQRLMDLANKSRVSASSKLTKEEVELAEILGWLDRFKKKEPPKPVNREVQSQIDRNTRDRETMNPEDYFGTGTKPKPTTPTPSKNPTPTTNQGGSEVDKGTTKPTPTRPTRPVTPPASRVPTYSRESKPAKPAIPAQTRQTPQGPKKFPAVATAPPPVDKKKFDANDNAKYQRLRKSDPEAAKKFGMKVNQAKYGKDFAKPKTPNPLMKDMPGRNKAELNTLRGNAAVNTIAKSPSAKKILSGTSKSSTANKIGQESLKRATMEELQIPAQTRQTPAGPKKFPAVSAPPPVDGIPAQTRQTPKGPKKFPAVSAPPAVNKKTMSNSLDIFDIIKGHLLDEGYAETEESAMVIMTNMSEEWRNEIVERYKGKHGQSSDEYKRDRSEGGKMVSGDDKQSGAEYTHGRRVKAENPGSQPDEGGKTKPKSQGKMDRGTRADLEYRKANLKKKEAEKKETNEEVELDENRRAARSAGASKDDRKKQPDPSKDGFTGIGNMSIDAIRKMSARIEKEESEKKKTKKEETELLKYPSEKKVTLEQIIALNKKYDNIEEGMGLVTGTAKAVNKVLKPVGQTPEEGKKAVGNLTKAMDTVAKPVKSAAKAVLGVSPEKNAAMMQKRRP